MTDPDEVLKELIEMRVELTAHIRDQAVWMERITPIIEAQGDVKMLSARVSFVNLLIEKEQERKLLRRAIIEKGVIAGLFAVVLYIASAVGNDIQSIVRGWVGKP